MWDDDEFCKFGDENLGMKHPMVSWYCTFSELTTIFHEDLIHLKPIHKKYHLMATPKTVDFTDGLVNARIHLSLGFWYSPYFNRQQ